jgi:hypothetical protein
MREIAGSTSSSQGLLWRRAGNVIRYAMSGQAIPSRGGDAVVQFSMFTPNRVGRLHDVVKLLASRDVHALANQ